MIKQVPEKFGCFCCNGFQKSVKFLSRLFLSCIVYCCLLVAMYSYSCLPASRAATQKNDPAFDCPLSCDLSGQEGCSTIEFEPFCKSGVPRAEGRLPPQKNRCIRAESGSCALGPQDFDLFRSTNWPCEAEARQSISNTYVWQQTARLMRISTYLPKISKAFRLPYLEKLPILGFHVSLGRVVLRILGGWSRRQLKKAER